MNRRNADGGCNVKFHGTFLDVLRKDLGFTGTKKACDRGNCGACTVVVGEMAVYACSLLAISVERKTIVTLEGLAGGEKLHPIQKAFPGHELAYSIPAPAIANAICDAVGVGCKRVPVSFARYWTVLRRFDRRLSRFTSKMDEPAFGRVPRAQRPPKCCPEGMPLRVNRLCFGVHLSRFTVETPSGEHLR